MKKIFLSIILSLSIGGPSFSDSPKYLEDICNPSNLFDKSTANLYDYCIGLIVGASRVMSLNCTAIQEMDDNERDNANKLITASAANFIVDGKSFDAAAEVPKIYEHILKNGLHSDECLACALIKALRQRYPCD